MNEKDIQQVLKRIRTVVYHVGTLEGSFPRILKNAPIYTRSHLIVFYEILPYLKHLLKFSSETIPVIGKILGLATEGKSDLEKASEYLRTINQSSETAVTEIFEALDQVSASLRKAQKSESADDEQKQTLKEANMQLMGIMNALQFQDITSQKIEATTALLANLGDGLVDLIKELGVEIGKHNITVREGTFDETAKFDRDSADEAQGEIDDLVNSNLTHVNGTQNGQAKKKDKPASKPKEETKAPAQNDAGGDAVVDMDNLDDLVASAQGGDAGDAVVDTDNLDDLVASAQGDAGGDAVVDMDNLDDLVASAKGEDETQGQDDIDALVASAQNGSGGQHDDKSGNDQDDIDALVASAQGGQDEDNDQPVGQDDIDALLASQGAGEDDNSGPVNQDDIDALLDQ